MQLVLIITTNNVCIARTPSCVSVYQYNFTLAANVHPYKISEKVLSDTTFQVHNYFHHYTMQRSLTVTYCAYFALVWHLHCTLSMHAVVQYM